MTALLGYIHTKMRGGVEWAVVHAADARVRRIRNRFADLVAKYRAGTLCPPRPRPLPRAEILPDGEQAAPKPAKPERTPSVLPRSFAWLCELVPQWAAGCGHQILRELDDPEMRELIAAAPQAGRLLRPLLWMTGRQVPTFLALPPRVRAPRSPSVPSDPARTRRPRTPSPTAPASSAAGSSAPAAVAPATDPNGPAVASVPKPPDPMAKWKTATATSFGWVILPR